MSTPELLALDQVCDALSVSLATGRNWVRLGKLNPARYEGNKPLFTGAYLASLLEELRSGGNPSLKARRNKGQLGGFSIPRSYLEDPGGALFLFMSELLGLKGLREEHVPLILADYAAGLFAERLGLPARTGLEGFLRGELRLGAYAPLIRDLLPEAPIGEATLRALSFRPQLPAPAGEGTADFLGFVYLSLRQSGGRKSAGAYYTPAACARDMLLELGNLGGLAGRKILDPCCGTGGFLLLAGEHGADPTLLHGVDIDPIAARLARINLALRFLPEDIGFLYKNIRCGDALLETGSPRYDIILGNPPWGASFTGEKTARYKEFYACAGRDGGKGKGKRTESCDLFVENALMRLRPGGSVYFVLPEALLNVKGHRAAREVILKQAELRSVSYLGNVFGEVYCPAITLLLTKSRGAEGKAPEGGARPGISVKTKERAFIIPASREIRPDSFQLDITEKEMAVLLKMERAGAVTLRGRADFALGIVTGNNREFLSGRPGPGREPVLRGGDIRKYGAGPASSWILTDFARFQQMAPLEHYRAPEKLVYRFVCAGTVFAYDGAGTLTLNSCNILIPRLDGIPMKYILAVLNSRAADFYVRKTFRSLKLLRSHIESIPIPAAAPEAMESLAAKAERILAATCAEDKRRAYERADREIMELYGLSRADRAVILEAQEARGLFL